MSKRRPDDHEMPTFGVTLAQVDALARLIQAVAAHGDVVAVGHVGDLAEGTLPQLGQAICDAAAALRAILDQVEGQRLGPPVRPGVAEAPAAYCLDRVGRFDRMVPENGLTGRSSRVA